mgnify:CR=1 FL=1
MKQRKYIFLTLVLCVFLSGCDAGKGEDETRTEIDPESIVSTINSIFCYTTSYDDFTDMAEAGSVIVYGEIMGLDHYMSGNGLCATKIDVKIMQPLKGEFKEGDTIQIVEDQGIATVEEYINSFTTEDLRETMRNDYRQYRDDELDDIYVQQLGFGDVMFDVGQKYVFILTESNNYDTEHTYSRINGPMGSFSELSDDHFYWTQGVGSTLAEEYGENASNMSLEDGKIKGETPRTLNGLMNEMGL